MENGRRPRISLCMIVKNEEKKLERALSWGEGILWEKVVVDTGSTDGTVALAERLGAKVCHFDWIDDFAAARNFALERAEGEGRVIPLGDDVPRSFVLADGGEGRPVIYLVPLSPAALSARAERDLPI